MLVLVVVEGIVEVLVTSAGCGAGWRVLRAVVVVSYFKIFLRFLRKLGL